MVSASFTALLLLVLFRVLGPEEYGVFALAMSVGGLVALGSNLGIASAAARFVAEARREPQLVHAVVTDALRLKLLVSGLTCIALAALAGPIADAYSEPALVWPIRLLAVSIFGESLFAFFSHLAEAEGRIASFLRVTAIESFIETFASIALVLAGLGAAGAMAGRAGAYVFAAGFAYVLFVRRLSSQPALLSRGAGHTKRIMRYGSALLIIEGAYVLFTSVDALLIGRIISVEAVGQFQAPLKLTVFLGYAGGAAASGVAPRLTRHADANDRRALETSLNRLMLLQGVFLAPLVVWATPITLLLLGDQFAPSASVLRAITPYAFLIAISPVLSQGVTYLGEARLRVPIVISALLVNLVFDLIMLPRIGIVAGAIGTDLAYVLYVVAHLLICRRMLGTPVRPVAITLVRVVAAALAMGVVLFAFGTGRLGIPVMILGGALGGAVYIGVLLLTRAVDLDELRRATGRVRARLS
jgi:O-antigen/teichoic acid export membrane protein